jgi:division protein CdvB (Snf7/Vps24/ESCRT-III family)
MVATYKISGILKQSTGVMRDVNSLVKIPELNRDMRQFSMELTKVFPPLSRHRSNGRRVL